MDEFKTMGLSVIAHYPILNKITGSTSRGFLLSQIMHLSKSGKEFYKTDKEFCQYLEMGASEFRTAKKWLTDSQIISVVKKGIPATSYYVVNIDRITSMLENATRDGGEPTSLQDTISQSNSENEQRIIKNEYTADQGENQQTGLPEFLGKTALARLVSVYELKFNDLYGFKPVTLNWAMLGRNFKESLTAYNEWQLASMVLLHFDWHGASGDDEFTYNRLADRAFPLEWVPKAANVYRAYLQNSLGLQFDDVAAVRKYVVSIIKPLYQAQNGTLVG